MPVYQLIDEIVFPPAEYANPEGLLAIGGDLSAERLIMAYQNGIFPWYSEGQPILWWSPDPRMVLFPKDFKRHKNLRKVVESNRFDIKLDHDFKAVIDHCSKVPRIGQDETWIVAEMKSAYVGLYKLGYAHSVETYLDGKLVGGLYGVSIGGSFFGESMFHTITDASKVALWHLVDLMLEWGFHMIDVQQDTAHLRSLGATTIPRKKFLHLLGKSNEIKHKPRRWN